MNRNQEKEKNDADAYRAGVNNESYYGAGSWEAYQRGKLAGEYGGKVRDAAGLFVVLILRPLLKFLTLYSPFILLGYLTIAPLLSFRSLSYHFNISSLLINLLYLAIPSYIYFSGFQFLRAIILHARKVNVGYWVMGYLLMLVFVTLCPAIFTFIIVGLIFSKGQLVFSNLLIIQIVFALVVLYKSYKNYDLLNELSTPVIAKWVFNIGKQFAEKKLGSNVRSASTTHENTPPSKIFVGSYIIMWGLCSYICFHIIFFIFFSIPGTSIKFSLMNNIKFIILISFYLAAFACWNFLKRQYQQVFLNPKNKITKSTFSDVSFIIMGATLLLPVLFTPFHVYTIPFSFKSINEWIILILSPVAALIMGILWNLNFYETKDVKSNKIQ